MSGNILKVNLEWLDGRKIKASARGSHLTVDQIYEDGREGMGFRPTELYLSALGACTMGTLLTFCQNMNIPIENFSVEVEGKREKKSREDQRGGNFHLVDRRYSRRSSGDAGAGGQGLSGPLHHDPSTED